MVGGNLFRVKGRSRDASAHRGIHTDLRISAAGDGGSIGLAGGDPLVAGAGDKIAGCVGAAVCREGDMIFEASSYGGFSSVVGEYRPDIVCRNYDGLIGADGKTSIAHKYIPGSGITLKWFLDNFGKTSGMSDFQELDARAELVHPGCDGLAAVGLLGGSAMPFDGGLKGMWIGYELDAPSGTFLPCPSGEFFL